MQNKLLKGLFGIIAATLSPFVILAIIGVFYVIFNIINGASLSSSAKSFVEHIYALKPYFPYLTTLPLLAGLVIILLRKRAIGLQHK